MNEGEPKPNPNPIQNQTEEKIGFNIPEAYSSTEGNPGTPFSPRERSRLSVYANILDRSHEIKDKLITERSYRFGFVDKGEMTEVLFTYSPELNQTLSTLAQRLYDAEFAGNERMEWAAQDLQSQVKAKYEKPTMSAKELSDLWNRDY